MWTCTWCSPVVRWRSWERFDNLDNDGQRRISLKWSLGPIRSDNSNGCRARQSNSGASVLSVCRRLSGLNLGRQIHSNMNGRDGFGGYACMLRKVGFRLRSNCLEKCRKKKKGRNKTTRNAICRLAYHGHANSTLKFLWELGKEAQPNDISYVRVMSSCCRAGLPEVGRR